MKKVTTGLQSGEQLMELFGGTRKKRVFLYLPTGIPGSRLYITNFIQSFSFLLLSFIKQEA